MNQDPNSLEAKVKALAVTLPEIRTEADYIEVAERLAATVALEKQVAEVFRPIIERQRAALDEAREQQAKFMNPLVAVERLAKQAMALWIAKQRAPPSIEDQVGAPDEELVAREVPRVEGVAAVKKGWAYVIRDAALLRSAYLTPDTAKIGKAVRALGPSAIEAVSLPNQRAIEVTETTTVAVKR